MSEWKVREYYDIIYLSPHLDDAVLSCGGQIAMHSNSGKSVLILTTMAGGSQITMMTRRLEDISACNVLGADYLHYGLPDCIYRRNKYDGSILYKTFEQIYGKIHPLDEEIIEKLCYLFRRIPPHGQIICPLSVGYHVDHQIVHIAANRIFKDSVLYYEEYPYTFKEDAVSKVTDKNEIYTPQIITLPPHAVSLKIKAIFKYESQLKPLFGCLTNIEEKIKGYMNNIGGERLWIRRRSKLGGDR